MSIYNDIFDIKLNPNVENVHQSYHFNKKLLFNIKFYNLPFFRAKKQKQILKFEKMSQRLHQAAIEKVLRNSCNSQNTNFKLLQKSKQDINVLVQEIFSQSEILRNKKIAIIRNQRQQYIDKHQIRNLFKTLTSIVCNLLKNQNHQQMQSDNLLSQIWKVFQVFSYKNGLDEFYFQQLKITTPAISQFFSLCFQSQISELFKALLTDSNVNNKFILVLVKGLMQSKLNKQQTCQIGLQILSALARSFLNQIQQFIQFLYRCNQESQAVQIVLSNFSYWKQYFGLILQFFQLYHTQKNVNSLDMKALNKNIETFLQIDRILEINSSKQSKILSFSYFVFCKNEKLNASITSLKITIFKFINRTITLPERINNLQFINQQFLCNIIQDLQSFGTKGFEIIEIYQNVSGARKLFIQMLNFLTLIINNSAEFSLLTQLTKQKINRNAISFLFFVFICSIYIFQEDKEIQENSPQLISSSIKHCFQLHKLPISDLLASFIESKPDLKKSMTDFCLQIAATFIFQAPNQVQIVLRENQWHLQIKQYVLTHSLSLYLHIISVLTLQKIEKSYLLEQFFILVAEKVHYFSTTEFIHVLKILLNVIDFLEQSDYSKIIQKIMFKVTQTFQRKKQLHDHFYDFCEVLTSKCSKLKIFQNIIRTQQNCVSQMVKSMIRTLLQQSNFMSQQNIDVWKKLQNISQDHKFIEIYGFFRFHFKILQKCIKLIKEFIYLQSNNNLQQNEIALKNVSSIFQLLRKCIQNVVTYNFRNQEQLEKSQIMIEQVFNIFLWNVDKMKSKQIQHACSIFQSFTKKQFGEIIANGQVKKNILIFNLTDPNCLNLIQSFLMKRNVSTKTYMKCIINLSLLLRENIDRSLAQYSLTRIRNIFKQKRVIAQISDEQLCKIFELMVHLSFYNQFFQIQYQNWQETYLTLAQFYCETYFDQIHQKNYEKAVTLKLKNHIAVRIHLQYVKLRFLNHKVYKNKSTEFAYVSWNEVSILLSLFNFNDLFPIIFAVSKNIETFDLEKRQQILSTTGWSLCKIMNGSQQLKTQYEQLFNPLTIIRFQILRYLEECKQNLDNHNFKGFQNNCRVLEVLQIVEKNINKLGKQYKEEILQRKTSRSFLCSQGTTLCTQNDQIII